MIIMISQEKEGLAILSPIGHLSKKTNHFAKLSSKYLHIFISSDDKIVIFLLFQ